MSQIIKTHADLCEERRKLQHLLAIQQQRVTDDWMSLKEEFAPVRKVFGAVGKIARPNNSNPLLSMGLKFASDIVLKNLVLSRAGWITKLAVPYLLRNYSSHALADTGKNIFAKIGRFFNKSTKSGAPSNNPSGGKEVLDDTVIN